MKRTQMTAQAMRRWTAAVLAMALSPVVSVAAGNAADPAVEKRVEQILAQLTPAERIVLLAGVKDFYTRGVERVGLPQFKMTDGPVGTRNDGRSTAYPAGVLLAATWDPAIARREGVALGRDARSRGDNILLGPGVNICREPQNGRNFEYFGEDPFLAAQTTVGYIDGVQSQGVAACVKHYACNNQETNRDAVDVLVDERTLHEIYLPAFEAAVRQAHVRTIMPSYNQVNGFHSTASKYLLTDVLRTEWGFDGMTISDWGAVHDTVGPLLAGLDLEMPGPKYFKPELVTPLVEQGKVPQALIDDKVRRLIRVGVEMGWLDRPQKDPMIAADDPANDAVALDVAREGIVLLKNQGNLLPLDRAKVHNVVLLGPGADRFVTGGGSSETKPARPVTILQGLQAVAGDVNYNRIPYASASADDMNKLVKATKFGPDGLTATFYAGTDLAGEPLLTRHDAKIDFNWNKRAAGAGVPRENFSARWTTKLRPTTSGGYLFAVRSDDGSRVKLDGRVIIDNWSDQQTHTASTQVELKADQTYDLAVEYYQGTGEATLQFGYEAVPPAFPSDQRQVIADADAVILCVNTHDSEGSDRSYALPADQERLLEAATQVNPRTIVLLESGGNVAMNGWIDHAPALVDAWYPGQAGGRAIAEVLFGDTNPSGRLPDTFDADFSQAAAFGHYPGKAQVDYAEGIYVGYRWFDHKGIEPRFPFGYGLSYTTFDIKNPRVTSSGTGDERTFTVTVDVANTGHRPGATVAQLYVHPSKGAVDRPVQELKGFARADLKSGEMRSVTIPLDRRSFSRWDASSHAWVAEAGTYELRLGQSSRDIACTTSVQW